MNYPIVRYRFECALDQPLRLPAYSGSMLRGAFGRALRRIVCVTGRSRCDGCPIRNNCAYTTIFEPGAGLDGRRRNRPPLYVIEPPTGVAALAAGDRLIFNMVLFGKALAQLSLLILAWQQALARGLGKTRARGRVTHVTRCDESVWSDQQPQVQPHEQTTRITSPPDATRINLQIKTPLRLQRQGKVLGAGDLTPADLMAGCLRRSGLVLAALGLTDNSGDIRALTEQAKTLTGKHDLTYVGWSRYSARQQRKMDLPGPIGDWHITGQLHPFLPSLYLCELLHVGKNASFGLGGYVIEDAG